MKRVAVAVLLLALVGVAACGDDEPEPAQPAAQVPPWAKVAPEQIAEAKKHGVPVAFENDLGMRFVLIPAGTFVMGSPEDEEGHMDNEAQHEVTISRPFYMQITEVTNGQYRSYAPPHEAPAWADQRRHSVVEVSWTEARAFARWLSRRGAARTYELPAEVEWEYACRSGATTAYSFGDRLSKADAAFSPLSPEGRFRAQNPQGIPFGGGIREVGSYVANAWGLCDMHGNVWEWCLDRDGHPDADPRDPTTATRTIRGGSYNAGPLSCRSASRDHLAASESLTDVGFRLVSPLPE